MRLFSNLQIDALLGYLKMALRSDVDLIGALDAAPDDIVRGVYRTQPVWQDERGRMTVEVQSLPCLCIYAESDTPTYASSEDGHLVNLVLWYVFDLPIPDVTPEGRPVPSAERAENWKEAVWHRVCYWLRQMRFPGEVDDEFVSFDLADEGKIDSLVPKRCEYFPPGVIGGFKATVEMVRTGPPYARPSPLLLKLIDVTLTNDPLDGPDVGAEIEVNT